MLTIIGVLVILAFLLTVASGAGKVPLWVPVLLLALVELIRILPLGR
jgi:hypothetical protein